MSITDRPIRVEDFVGVQTSPECGAAVTFLGVVRSPNKGREVTGIIYECYREMAEAEIERVTGEVKKRFPVSEVRVSHRIGHVAVGEVSLLVVVWGGHRSEAFAAAEAVVDELKRRAPIWKKELYADETSHWL